MMSVFSVATNGTKKQKRVDGNGVEKPARKVRAKNKDSAGGANTGARPKPKKVKKKSAPKPASQA